MSVEHLIPRQSREESRLCDALLARAKTMDSFESMLVAPQPTVIAGGRRFRPDVFLYKNSAVVVELDDPSHYGGERYVADRTRDYLMEDCGVQVLRVPLEDTHHPDGLDEWVQRIVSRVHRMRCA